VFNQSLTDMSRTEATYTVNRMLAAKEVSLRSQIGALVVEACEFKRKRIGMDRERVAINLSIKRDV